MPAVESATLRDGSGRFVRGHPSVRPIVKRLTKTCLVCGASFYTYPSVIKSQHGKYCSKGCADAAKSYSHANAGSFKKGMIPWHKGKVMSLDYRERCHRAQQGKKMSIEARRRISESKKGEKSPLWKGGVSGNNLLEREGVEFRLWREAIFTRDAWCCQKCGRKGVTLHPHHIESFASCLELRFAVDNGITLCRECHQEFHKRFGAGGNTREQLKEYLGGCFI